MARQLLQVIDDLASRRVNKGHREFQPDKKNREHTKLDNLFLCEQLLWRGVDLAGNVHTACVEYFRQSVCKDLLGDAEHRRHCSSQSFFAYHRLKRILPHVQQFAIQNLFIDQSLQEFLILCGHGSSRLAED